MDDFTIARVIHVAAVLLWIGGVAFVTSVLMPALMRETPPNERLSVFHRFEGRFAAQARIWVGLAGLSGFWMIWRANLWDRFLDPRFWWMHAMLIVWLGFSLMLYVVEPFFLHHKMQDAVSLDLFPRMLTMHRIALAVSLITLFGAVAGSHGLM